jgi:hypothetical protein
MSSLVNTAGVITRAIEPALAIARQTACPTLMNFAARDRMFTKRNRNIEWIVDVGGAQATVEDITTNGIATDQDTTVAASLPIAAQRIKHQFSLSRILAAEAALLAPEELADLFQASVIRGVTAICRQLNTFIHSGTGLPATASITGLTNLSTTANVATGTYAGIDRALRTSWRISQLNGGSPTATPRPLTVDLLLALNEALQIRESYFDMIVMHPSVATRYARLFIATAGGFGLTPDEEANGLSKVELGLGGRYWNGIPIIEDPQCAIDRVYTLNSSEMAIWSFAVDTGDDMANTALIDPSVTYGINIHLAELPSLNSANRVFELYTLPQFQVRNLMAVGAIIDLNLL